MNKKILYIKSKWLDDKVLNSKVKVKNRLLPLDKYLYDFMFVKNNYKERLIKHKEDKYRIFDNGIESNLNLYLKLNKERLINKDFTIISNDCWGAYVYTYLGIKYNSPFVWLWLSSVDFIKLAKNFKEYMECKLRFIETDLPHPVGMLDDITLYFNHYKTEKDALECFEKRNERINYDNLFFRMALEDENLIKDFNEIPYKNKVMFFDKDKLSNENLVNENIVLMQSNDDYQSFGQYAQLQSYKYFDIIEWLNSGNVVSTCPNNNSLESI